MPAFLDPNVIRTSPEPYSLPELTRALRLGIASEHEAIATYEAHAEASPDPIVAKVLQAIAREERVHVGELTALLQYLLGDEDITMDEGRKEVAKEAKTNANGASVEQTQPAPAEPAAPATPEETQPAPSPEPQP